VEALLIPKTASTSVLACINQRSQSWGHYRIGNIPEEKRKTVWSAIRNPYDRAVSMYHYANRLVRVPLSFLDWFLSGKSLQFEKDLYFNSPIVKFVTIDGKLAVPTIIEFAELESFVRKTYGVELPHLNKSKGRKPYQEYYDDESFNLITTKYKDDLDMFGYQW